VTDLVDLIQSSNSDAVAMADILHYNREKINTIREYAINSGVNLTCHD
jgi:imidazole glycerol phosphate synthase subunit HisF